MNSQAHADGNEDHPIHPNVKLLLHHVAPRPTESNQMFYLVKGPLRLGSGPSATSYFLESSKILPSRSAKASLETAKDRNLEAKGS